jgi:hypothetical protein
MSLVRCGVAALALATGYASADERTPAAPPNPAANFKTTHKLVTSVEVKRTGAASLQTLCTDAEGRVLGLVAAAKPYNAPLKGATAEVHVFAPDGKPLTTYKVPFHGHSINCAPDGTVYVAGDGRVAKFDRDGKMIGEPAELPHVAAMLKDKDELKKRAEAQLKRENEMYTQMISDSKKQFAEQIKRLEEKKAEDRTKTEARQLDQFKTLLKQYETMENERKGRTVEQVMTEMTGRLRVINGVAVSDKDVFVACGDTRGFGYAVWRLTRALKEPKQVLGEIGGCCGQIDIQCHGPDLLVAENTKHQFARYDRDGKPLGRYGKRGADTDPACFGSCCNPMNVRAVGTGDIYTAESEGVIKRFSPSGEFLGTAAVVNLTGGCKNVAVGASPDGSKLYFCDQPGSKFHVLEKK